MAGLDGDEHTSAVNGFAAFSSVTASRRIFNWLIKFSSLAAVSVAAVIKPTTSATCRSFGDDKAASIRLMSEVLVGMLFMASPFLCWLAIKSDASVGFVSRSFVAPRIRNL